MLFVARSYLVAVVVGLVISACSKQESRWQAAEERAQAAADSERSAAPAAPRVAGSKFNAFFPDGGRGGATRVFTAEKDGYAEAKLTRDGADLATLSISQAAPDALAKYDSVSENVDGYPLVKVGNNQSSVLVNKKYQVKVSSKELGPAERKELLASFNLKGLASL